MKRIFSLIILLFFAYLSFAQTQTRAIHLAPSDNPDPSQKRKAVVIGMSNYGGNNTLDNTLNDAKDMANVFQQLGFDVTLLSDNNLQELRTNLAAWYKSIEGNDMAVFYYAGHGISDHQNKNYLIPIGAADQLKSEADLPTYALPLGNVLDNLDYSHVKMKLVILDACRSKDLTRSWTRGGGDNGLRSISATEGTYIAFSTSPNSKAQDGGDLGNGVFTYYLKDEILKPGLSISDIFDEVANYVFVRTDNSQVVDRSNKLTNKFYFIPPTPGDNPAPYNPPSPVPYNPPTPVIPSSAKVFLNCSYEFKGYKDDAFSSDPGIFCDIISQALSEKDCEVTDNKEDADYELTLVTSTTQRSDGKNGQFPILSYYANVKGTLYNRSTQTKTVFSFLNDPDSYAAGKSPEDAATKAFKLPELKDKVMDKILPKIKN